jgi:hypothetical protein
LPYDVGGYWLWWLIGGIAAGIAGSFFARRTDWKKIFS